MKYLFLGILIIFPLVLLSQTKLGGDFILYNNSNYLISAEEVSDGFKFTLTNGLLDKDNTASFSIPTSQFNLETFSKNFERELQTISKTSDGKEDSKFKQEVEDDNKAEISKVFYRYAGIVNVMDNLNYEPNAGRLFYARRIEMLRYNYHRLRYLKKKVINKKLKRKGDWFGIGGELQFDSKGIDYRRKRPAKRFILDTLINSEDIRYRRNLDSISNRVLSKVKEYKNIEEMLNSIREKRDQRVIGKVNFQNAIDSIEKRTASVEQQLEANFQSVSALKLELLRETLDGGLNAGGRYEYTVKEKEEALFSSSSEEGITTNYFELSQELNSFNARMRDNWTLLKNQSDQYLTQVNDSISSYTARLGTTLVDSTRRRILSVIDDYTFRKQNEEEYIQNREKSHVKKVSARNRYKKLIDSSRAVLSRRIAWLGQIRLLEETIPRIPNYVESEEKTIRTFDHSIRLWNDSIQVILAQLNNAKKQVNETAKSFDSERSKIYKIWMNVDTLQVEINEGYIENISASGFVSLDTLKIEHQLRRKLDIQAGRPISEYQNLENQYPLGFSSKIDYMKLKGRRINSFGPGINGTPVISAELGDIIQYIPDLQVDRRDYSPANQKVYVTPGSEPKNFIDLKKLNRKYLFELKTFTDFVGVVSENEPNGLVQFEVEKRINLKTARFYNPNSGLIRAINFGVFQYVIPTIVFSKIESDDRRLILPRNAEGDLYASTLDLRQLQNFRFGSDVNLLVVDNPRTKVTWYLNTGIYYGNTALLDSLSATEPEFTTNTFEVPFRSGILIKSDESFQFDISFTHSVFYSRNDRFFQVANSDFFERRGDVNNRSRFQYNTVNFGFAFNPNQAQNNEPLNQTGRLFLRYSFNWQQGFWNTTFHQLQVGYSVPLFSQITNGK